MCTFLPGKSKYFLITIVLCLHNCIDCILFFCFTLFSKMPCSATFSAYNIPRNYPISSIMPNSATSVAKYSFTRESNCSIRWIKFLNYGFCLNCCLLFFCNLLIVSFAESLSFGCSISF